MSEEDQVDFDNRTACYACGIMTHPSKLFLDHCHASGQYRGPSCRSCNRKMYERKSFKLWFHNLEGFDSHLIASGKGIMLVWYRVGQKKNVPLSQCVVGLAYK